MEHLKSSYLEKTTPSNIFKPESEKWLKDTVVEYLEGNDIELACYCKPKCCHGDVLKDAIIYIANRNKNKFRAMQNKDDFEAKRKELELMLSVEHQMSIPKTELN